MSTEIKNTLFRFVTMRAPELIEKDEVAKNFVQHPEITKTPTDTFDSEFYGAVNAIPSGKTKKEFLKETATAFENEAAKDREAVKTIVGSDLYEFAVWLTANRTSLTSDDLIQKINYSGETLRQAPLTSGLNAADRIALWDNLFYQIITFKSGYVREALLSVLVADFFLNHYSNIGNADSAIRKLAQARVIIPKDIFSPEEITTNSTGRNSVASDISITSELKNVVEIVQLEDILATVKESLSDLSAIEKRYQKVNENDLLAYNRDFDQSVTAAYNLATKIERIVKDPKTLETKVVVEYQNLRLPEYNYVPKAELDFALESCEEDSPLAIVINKRLNEGFDKISEVLSFIEAKQNEITTKLFELSDLSQKMVSVDGMVLPVTNNSYARTENNFVLSSLGTNSTKKLVVSLNGMDAGADIVSGSYSVTFQGEQPITRTFNAIDDNWVNGKLVLTLFSHFTEYFPTDNTGNFDFAGTFYSSTNKMLTVNGKGNAYNELAAINKTNPFLITERPDGSPTSDFKILGGGTFVYDGLPEFSDPDTTSGNSTTSTSTTNQNAVDYIPSGFGIKRLGIADYRKVEQEVCCYVPGEVSHIENVMAREYKEKSTRRLRRQEDTTNLSSERETENLSENTSTSRFEMNQEINTVLSEQNTMGTNSEFHWGEKRGGSVHGDFANTTSSEESNHQAVTQAKDVTERALERVVQKVKEERVTKIVEEYEETSKHGYDNRKGDKHVSGVYRWIDKVFKNKVVNYGKRLMYEFMIPEPAAFHKSAIVLDDATAKLEQLIKPLDPRTGNGSLALSTHKSVTENNYQHWAALFNAEVTPCPEKTITVGKSFSQNKSSNDDYSSSNADTVKIPDGYYSTSVNLKLNELAPYGWDAGLGFGHHVISGAGSSLANIGTASKISTPQKYTGELPISYFSMAAHASSGTIEVTCELTTAAFEQWQIETFNTIISSYEDRLADYNNKMAQLKEAQADKVKTNPLLYRQIESTVLRKNCIEYLVGHNALGGASMLVGVDVKDIRAKYDSRDLETYAAKVKFFEQAFEWDLMSYYLYPFYWAEKSKWQKLYNTDQSDDALFRAFLQSGMARVILTVRPGFEEAVNWYMATGQIWNGGQVPTMDDPLFISIIEELREQDGTVEETWESRVPTSLTVIQAGSIGLNVEGLPCDKDCADFKLFDSDGNQVFNADGTPVSTNPIQQNVDSNNNNVLLGNVTEDLQTVTDSIETIQADIEEIKATLATNAGN